VKELDEADREILRILQISAEVPYSRISARLGVSKATVHKRIRQLKEKGIIEKICAVVNPGALGKKIKAFIGVSTNPGACREVIERLQNMHEILEIHEVVGEHDLLLKVVVESVDRLNDLLHEIDRLPGVSTSRTLIVLKTEKETTFVEP